MDDFRSENFNVDVTVSSGVNYARVSPQERGIALLIEMAQRGEIDPWDVQVIDVIDRVLEELLRREDEADLSQSGQAFLYASMLVWLKANSLDAAENTDENASEEEAEEFMEVVTDAGQRVLPLRLEKQLKRRAIARPVKQRRVTLQELIDQLRLMSNTIAQQSGKRPRRRISSLSRDQAVRTITQLAHEENLSEIAQELEQLIAHRWMQLTRGGEWLDLEHLVASQPKNDRVGVFWALLLLSAQSKVELAQEEFYQDLKIRALAQ